MTLRAVSLALIAMVFLTAGTGISVAGEEDETLINSDDFGKTNAASPSLVGLPDSSLIATWIDARRGHADIFSAHISTEGVPLGDVNLLNDDNQFAQQGSPVAAAAPDGSLIWVVWKDRRDRDNLYAQRLLPDGTLLGDNIRVLQDESGFNRENHAIAVASDGTVLIVWEQVNTFDARRSILGQRIGADGLLLGDGFTEIRESGERPGVTRRLSGGWAVVWEERHGGVDYDASFMLLDDKLAQDGLIFPVGEVTSADQVDAQVAALPDSSFAVAWRDTRGGEASVFLRRFSKAGVPISSDTRVDEDDPRQEKDLTVAVQSDGSFFVGWHGVDDSGDWIPTGRGYFADGTPNGGVFRVDEPEDVVSQNLSITPTADGRFACAWSDAREGPTLNYAKLVDPPSDPVEFPIPLLHLEPGATQVFPDVALHADGSAMAIWVDQRTGSPNLFGQLLDPQGNLSGGNFLISEEPLGRFGDPFNITVFLVSTPKVAAADSGNYLATWLSASSGAGKVVGQIFDETGAPLGNNFLIVPEHAVAQASPNAMVDNRTGRMAVVWEDNIFDTGGDVFLRRYSALGEPEEDVILLVDENRRSAAQVLPSAEISIFGEILAAWVDDRNGGNDIYAQSYDIEEDVEIDNFFVAGEDQGGINFNQLNPSVAIGPNSYIIVWDDDADGTFGVEGLLEVLPSFERGKNRLANPLQTIRLDISEPPEGDHLHFPKVSIDANSRIVVTWWDNLDGQAKILGRLYEPDGTAFTDPFLVTPFREDASRFSPSTDTRGDSIQFIFADSRRRLGWDVYTRRTDWGFEGDSIPDDSTIVPVFVSQAGVMPVELGLRIQWISPLDIFPSSFQVLRRGPLLNPADPASGRSDQFAEVSWIDRTGRLMGWTDHDVIPGESYAYWVLLGDLGPVAGPFTATYDPTSPVALHAYPVPFSDGVTLRLPPADAERVLEIYDARGRRVWQGGWPGGADPVLVTWDGRNLQGRPLPQGVYWARLAGGVEIQTVRLLRLRR